MAAKNRRSRGRKKKSKSQLPTPQTERSITQPENEPPPPADPTEGAGPSQGMVASFTHEQTVTRIRRPIPEAKELASLEQVKPGITDWILARAERAQDHQMNIEDRSLTAVVGTEKRGQWLGFILTLAFLLGSAFGVIQGNAASVFYSLLAVFILGRAPEWTTKWREVFTGQSEKTEE